MVSKACLIYVTAPKKKAKEIAQRLVEEKLVACVNILEIDSVYRWEGRLCEEKECALILKTRKTLADKVIKRVRELHPYELPCILLLPVSGGLQEFIRWISESTS